MWRLITVSYAFLAAAFYQLSGGSDYQPAENSLQIANVKAAEERSLKRELQLAAVIEPETEIVVTTAIAQVPIVDQGQVVLDTALAKGLVTEAVDTDVTRSAVDLSTTTLVADTALVVEIQEDPLDIRRVTGSRVNLRMGPGTDYDAIGKLTKGTRVEVIRDDGDGWVKLQAVESGTIGWMADFLLEKTDT